MNPRFNDTYPATGRNIGTVATRMGGKQPTSAELISASDKMLGIQRGPVDFSSSVPPPKPKPKGIALPSKDIIALNRLQQQGTPSLGGFANWYGGQYLDGAQKFGNRVAGLGDSMVLGATTFAGQLGASANPIAPASASAAQPEAQKPPLLGNTNQQTSPFNPDGYVIGDVSREGTGQPNPSPAITLPTPPPLAAPAATTAQPGAAFKTSDSGLPYQTLGNQVAFTNPDGSGQGTITGSKDLAQRMNDGKGGLSVMKLESPNAPAADPELALRQQMLQQALTAPNAATQDIGGFLATKAQQKAAQTALGLEQGQQKIDADIAGNKATAQAAGNKLAQDYQLEQQKLGIEQQKADAPLLNSRKLYNDLGQVTGEVTDVIDRKSGQPMQNQSNDARFQSALQAILDEPSLTEARRIEAIKKLRQVHSAQQGQPARQ